MVSRTIIAIIGAVWALTGAAGAGLPVREQTIVEKTPSYDLDYKYPLTGNAAIDGLIEGWAKKEAAAFSAMGAEDKPPPDRRYDTELTYEVVRNDAAMFGVLFTTYAYTGGAHPNSNFTTFNFLLPGGEDVEIGELFTGEGLRQISALSIAQLRAALGRDDMTDDDWIARGAAPNGKNLANFVLLRDELTIYFDAYQVAAYAAGPQEAHIPLDEIRAFLRPDPLMPAASFDCARAATPIERGICSTRALARLDRRVADEYFDALSWAVDDAARAKLKTAQRAWLMSRDNTCAAAGANMAACLTASYEARLKALKER